MKLKSGPQTRWVIYRKAKGGPTFIRSYYSCGTTSRMKDACLFQSEDDAKKTLDMIERERGVGWAMIGDPRDFMFKAFGFDYKKGKLSVEEVYFAEDTKILAAVPERLDYHATALCLAYATPAIAWKILQESLVKDSQYHLNQLKEMDEQIGQCMQALAALKFENVVAIGGSKKGGL